MQPRRAVIFAAILVLVVALDQGSKAWARTLPVSPARCDVPADLIARTCHGVPQPVIDGYWEWELAMNTGHSCAHRVVPACAPWILSPTCHRMKSVTTP